MAQVLIAALAVNPSLRTLEDTGTPMARRPTIHEAVFALTAVVRMSRLSALASSWHMVITFHVALRRLSCTFFRCRAASSLTVSTQPFHE